MQCVYVPESDLWMMLATDYYVDRHQFALVQKVDPTQKKIMPVLIPNTASGRAIIRSMNVRGMFRDCPLDQEFWSRDTQEWSLPEDIDFGTYPPLDHQREPIAKAIMLNQYLLAMDMGTGKTYTSIQVMRYLFKKNNDVHFVVICPRTVIPTWSAQLEKYAPELKAFPLGDNFSVAARTNLMIPALFCPGSVLICSYDTFNKNKESVLKCPDCGRVVKDTGNGVYTCKKCEWYGEPDHTGGFGAVIDLCYQFGTPLAGGGVDPIKFTALFLDESTKIKNTSAARTQGIMKLRAISERRYALTGFPSPNSPADYVAQCAFLHPWYLGYASSTAYTQDWAIKDGNGQIIGWHENASLKQALPNFAIRLDMSDTTIELPPIVYKEIMVPMEENQAKIYKHTEHLFEAWLDENLAKLPTGEVNPCSTCGGLGMLYAPDTPEGWSCDACNGLGTIQHGSKEFAIIVKTALVLMQKLTQVTGGWAPVSIPCKKCKGTKIISDKIVKGERYCIGTLRHVELKDGRKFHSLFVDFDPVTCDVKKVSVYNNQIDADLGLVHPLELPVSYCNKCNAEATATEHAPLLVNPKMDALVEFIQGEQIHKPYVIFSHFRHELEEMQNRLGIPVIWGGTTEEQLVSIIKQLQEGQIEGVCIQPAAGGMGVDGLQCCRTAMYYTNSTNLENRVQSEKRLHRIGQKGTVTVIDFKCPNTFDDKVIERLKQKKEIGLDILSYLRKEKV